MIFAGKLLSILLGEAQVDTGKILDKLLLYEKQDFGIIVKVLLQLFNRKYSEPLDQGWLARQVGIERKAAA